MDVWIDGWMDGWMNAWMDGWIFINAHKVNVSGTSIRYNTTPTLKSSTSLGWQNLSYIKRGRRYVNIAHFWCIFYQSYYSDGRIFYQSYRVLGEALCLQTIYR